MRIRGVCSCGFAKDGQACKTWHAMNPAIRLGQRNTDVIVVTEQRMAEPITHPFC